MSFGCMENGENGGELGRICEFSNLREAMVINFIKGSHDDKCEMGR